MEGFFYDSSIAQSITTFVRFVAPFMPVPVLLYWLYSGSDKDGNAYQDRINDQSDDQMQ